MVVSDPAREKSSMDIVEWQYHHIWWPKRDYKTDLEIAFREHPLNIILTHPVSHALLHLHTEPPTKPTTEEMEKFLSDHPLQSEACPDSSCQNGFKKGVEIAFERNGTIEVIVVRCEGARTGCFSPEITLYESNRSYSTPGHHRPGEVTFPLTPVSLNPEIFALITEIDSEHSDRGNGNGKKAFSYIPSKGNGKGNGNGSSRSTTKGGNGHGKPHDGNGHSPRNHSGSNGYKPSSSRSKGGNGGRKRHSSGGKKGRPNILDHEEVSQTHGNRFCRKDY